MIESQIGLIFVIVTVVRAPAGRARAAVLATWLALSAVGGTLAQRRLDEMQRDADAAAESLLSRSQVAPAFDISRASDRDLTASHCRIVDRHPVLLWVRIDYTLQCDGGATGITLYLDRGHVAAATIH